MNFFLKLFTTLLPVFFFLYSMVFKNLPRRYLGKPESIWLNLLLLAVVVVLNIVCSWLLNAKFSKNQRSIFFLLLPVSFIFIALSYWYSFHTGDNQFLFTGDCGEGLKTTQNCNGMERKKSQYQIVKMQGIPRQETCQNFQKFKLIGNAVNNTRVCNFSVRMGWKWTQCATYGIRDYYKCFICRAGNQSFLQGIRFDCSLAIIYKATNERLERIPLLLQEDK